MQFKLLTVAALFTAISSQSAPDALSCLVKKECKTDEGCIGGCFEVEKAKGDQGKNFAMCAKGRCGSEAGDIGKFNECLVKCYNNIIGKPNGTIIDPNAKPTEKKEEEKKDEKKEEKKDENPTTTTISGKSDDKPTSANDATPTSAGENAKPTTTSTSNAFKVIPSVFTAFVLAALAL